MPSLPPTTGAPLSLYVPPFDYGVGPNDFTYDVPVNDNWTILNNFAGTVILKNPTASQTVTQPAATYFNQNSPLIFGANAILRFGTAADIWDSSLTRTSAGNFTLDSNTPGDGQGSLILKNATAAVVNATTGYKYAGAAPSGHILVGNGSEYVDGTVADVAAYQEVEFNSISTYPSRPILNFLPPLTVTDDAGNDSTDIGLANSGVTAGSYSLPNLTINAKGLVTSASSSTLVRVDTENGSYILYPDGTIFQWGQTPNAPGSGSAVNLSITFPTAFPNAVMTVQATPINSPGGDGNPHPMSAHVNTFSLSGAEIILAIPTQIGGSGYAGPILTSQYAMWFAIGH